MGIFSAKIPVAKSPHLSISVGFVFSEICIRLRGHTDEPVLTNVYQRYVISNFKVRKFTSCGTVSFSAKVQIILHTGHHLWVLLNSRNNYAYSQQSSLFDDVYDYNKLLAQVTPPLSITSRPPTPHVGEVYKRFFYKGGVSIHCLYK